ncbi:MAG TPA: hypothetical protein DCE80_08715 [Ignavibacteriales bacterium]|nr:hypothetical protein [Ignavibacteriales bacterium]
MLLLIISAQLKNFLIVEDDELATPSVGPWAKTKYQIIYDYMVLFSSGMKKHWANRIYIDIYAGAGKAKIEKTNEILYSSPMLALKVDDPFDKYIFCEKDKKLYQALEQRIKNEHFEESHVIFNGDCNEIADTILKEIPQHSRKNNVLSFCFVDPFSLKIEFETIKKLSTKFMDFLVLLAFGMDGKRNITHYVKDNNKRIDKFLGLEDWRSRWEIANKKHINLVEFLAKEFTQQMVNLGYLEEAIDNFIAIHSDERNLPLYYLAFYSRNKIGYDFWNKVKMRNTDPTLFD